jgi:soluble lytic murein transglycosylase-like protein
MAGLLDLNDPSDQWTIDPATLAAMASAAGTPTWTPGDGTPSSDATPGDATLAPTDAQPAPAGPAAPPATMADTGGGFWHSLASGIGNAGLALGGGIDPSITGDAAGIAGRRALLNFSLAMLANSGPSYTPRNFGQILASGLAAADQSTLQTEQTRLKAQQVAATYALKAGQQQIQAYLAKITGAKFAQESGRRAAVSGVAGGAAPPAAGATPAGAAGDTVGPVAPPDGAYGQGGPDTTPVPDEYLPYFQEASARTGIPVDVLIAQARQESSFKPDARGKSGEIGLAQVMPSTALAPGAGVAPVDPAKLTDARTAINFQADYLRAKIPAGMDPSDPVAIRHALVGYNGGGDKDYVAHVTRYLPPPPTSAQYAGPGAGGPAAPAPSSPAPGATVPTSSVVAPAPSSTPPSVAATVFGPGSPGWQTLPPAVLPDVAARKAEIEDTYQRDRAVASASGNDTLLQKANQDRQASLAALNKQVADAQAAHQKAEIDLNAKQVEQQKTIAATAADNQARIQAENARAQAERDHATQLAKIQAGYTAAQHQTDADREVGRKQLEAMGTQAEKAETIQPMVRSLIPLLKNAPSGAVGQLLQTYPEWINTLASAGIIKPETQTAAQLINGLTDYLSLDLKPVATGALRTQEIPMLKGLGPQLAQSTQAQQQAAARILNFTQRVKDEYDLAQQNFGAVDAAGQPNYKILYKNIDAPMQLDDNGRRVGGGLGPVVPEPPPLQANPTKEDLTAMQRYQKYVGNLPSGMPYHVYERQPNGSYQKVLKVQP